MKKPALLLSLFFVAISSNISAWAQPGIINTVVGNGTGTYTGDGSIAINTGIGYGYGLAIDSRNNLYFTDEDYSRIRMLTPSGIVKTIAGNGTGGDGGPATAASVGYLQENAICIDRYGNLYFAEGDGGSGGRIRKIDTAGIISTIAGNGSGGHTGDGGAATAAGISVCSIVIDNSGNLYFSDGYFNTIREVSTIGIITTIAGTGTTGFSGDGGPAIAAQFNVPMGLVFDRSGNLYVADSGNGRIRMINTAGIVSTAAGNGASALTTGDGGLALSACIPGPTAICLDSAGDLYVLQQNSTVRRIDTHDIITTIAGNGTYGFTGDAWLGYLAELGGPWGGNNICIGNGGLYIADGRNNRIRKVGLTWASGADSFYIDLAKSCKGMTFSILPNTYTPTETLRTYYGDGTSDTVPVVNYGLASYAVTSHIYTVSGTYTIKHVLRNGSTSIDSISYPEVFSLCNSLPVKFYTDLAGTCSYDSATDPINQVPVLTEVDSNGIAVDTVSATGGFYYTAYGNIGDVYSFRELTTIPVLPNVCPSTRLLNDTLLPALDTDVTKFFGFGCSASPDFDLAVSAVIPVTGVHDEWGDIHVQNIACYPETATVTLNFSPKYVYTGDAVPIPSSVTSTSLTWNLGTLSVGDPYLPLDIFYEIWSNPAIGDLTVRDTVHSFVQVTPTTGDANPTNNTCIVIDTVKAGVDPNEMWVSPQGYIASGTQLEYTINFMNTGNDTAFNIYVMDTLSDFLDPKSLRIVSASNVMNVTQIYDNIYHHIIRFDFPNIDLLDSSFHNQCNSMFNFTLNTYNGLADRSAIFNEAGIYFDSNAVVMTNEVEDIIGLPNDQVPVVHSSYLSTQHVSLYPNPTSNTLTLKTDANAYNTCVISNTIGQEMLVQIISGAQTTINVTSLPPGIYYVTCRGASGPSVVKFVKM